MLAIKKIEALKPADKDYKQSDAGGLYLKVLKSVASHQSLRATRLVLSTMCQSSRLMARGGWFNAAPLRGALTNYSAPSMSIRSVSAHVSRTAFAAWYSGLK